MSTKKKHTAADAANHELFVIANKSRTAFFAENERDYWATNYLRYAHLMTYEEAVSKLNQEPSKAYWGDTDCARLMRNGCIVPACLVLYENKAHESVNFAITNKDGTKFIAVDETNDKYVVSLVADHSHLFTEKAARSFLEQPKTKAWWGGDAEFAAFMRYAVIRPVSLKFGVVEEKSK